MVIANILAFAILLLILVTAIKNRILFWFIIPLFTIVLILQVSSVLIGDGFVNYKFITHFNGRDIRAMADMFFTRVLLVCVVAVIFVFLLYKISGKFESFVLYSNRKLRYLIVALCIVVMCLNSGMFYSTYIIFKIYTADTSSFESARLRLGMDPYVITDDIEATKGKNIIILSIESLEAGFLSEKYADLTPNIRALRDKWNYTDMRQVRGCGWTSASLYALLTGLPAYFKGEGNSYFQNAYGSKISSLGDILHKAGYDMTFYIGDADFAGTNDLLSSFNITDVVDRKNMEERYGAELAAARDKDLFYAVKKELIRKKEAGNSSPFALFISTVDTHHPDGIRDDRFAGVLPERATNLEFMVSAIDRMVAEFVRFVEEEGFLENTSIFIFPDHLKMGDASLFNGTGERNLYLLSNSVADNTSDPKPSNFSQLDLPGTILKTAHVEHNVKFLSDYVDKSTDIDHFVRDNITLITGLNTAGLLRTEIWSDEMIIATTSNGAQIRFGGNEHNISRDTLSNFITRMTFSNEMRLLTTEVLPASKKLPLLPPDQVAVDVSFGNNMIMGLLHRQGRQPMLKTDASLISFRQSDITLLADLPFRTESRSASTFTFTGRDAIEIHSSEEPYTEYAIQVPYDVVGGFIELEYSTKGEANPFVILHSQPYEARSLAVHDNIPPSAERNVVRLPITKEVSNSLMIFRNWSGKGSFTVFRYNILGVGYPNDYRFTNRSGNASEYATQTDRFIAHAGGSVNGDKYTNSLEALDYNYARGFRLFELDIVETSDGKFVAAHDWDFWARVTSYQGSMPVSEKEFLERKILGRYTPLNMNRINEWFTAHPDAILVTDKVNTPKKFATAFVDKKRLMMELFSLDAVKEAVSAGVATPIMNEDVLAQLSGDRIATLTKLGVKGVALSRGAIARELELLRLLKRNGIKAYVFHVNFEEGKDEKYVVDYELDHVYGLYADDWTFK